MNTIGYNAAMPDETTANDNGAVDPQPDTFDLLKNRYRLLEIIGEGGMAIVWRAEDTELGRTVAVKILRGQYASDPEFLARFRSEARAAATLNDPGVVGVYDVGVDDGRYFLVLEYVPGRDLKAVIRDEAPLAVEKAVAIGVRLARAVAAAHRGGLVHRDIKPQNVLVAPDGRMKVADFGIARAAASLGLTEPGIVMGTVHYIAPEQAAGGSASTASDVYSLGVVMYEMLTGRVPLDADSTLGVAMRIMNETAEPVDQINPTVPAVLAQIVARAMAKQPERRYPSAGDLADALEGFRRWSEQSTGPIDAIPTLVGSDNGGAGSARPFDEDEKPPNRAANSGRTARGHEPILDLPGLGLAVLAALALAGLIPLWMAVIARAQTPESGEAGQGWWPVKVEEVATEAPTPLPTVAFSRVPDVIGKEQADAIEALEAAGLASSIDLVSGTGEALGRVVQQSSPAGDEVEVDSVIRLSVSAAGRVIVPNPGPDFASTQLALDSLGLSTQRRDVWTGSAGPAGSIASLFPVPGSEVPIGMTILVTVASGAWLPINVNFEGNVYLSGVDLAASAYAAGSAVVVRPVWQAMEDLDRDLGARVIVADLTGFNLELGRAEHGIAAERPSNEWAKGEREIGAAFEVPIDAGATPGAYGLWLELFALDAPDVPMAITGPGDKTFNGTRLLIQQIQILAADSG